MKFRTVDGALFNAGSYRELAEQLWESQFIPPATLELWMKGSAERAKLWNNSDIRTDSVENHIKDLIAAGLVEELA